MAYDVKKSREYYLKNRERIRKKQKEFYDKNQERLVAYSRKYKEENREKVNASSRASNKKYYQKYYSHKKEYNAKLWLKLRKDTMKILGGEKCVKCGFSDYRALHIDHINGGGNKHIKSFSSNKTYHKYIKDNPSEFQVLCANCNFIKKTENKEYREQNI